MVIDLPHPPDGLYDDIPAGSWVALSLDEQRVLAYGESLDEVSDKARALGVTDFVIDKVLPAGGFVF